MSTAKKTDAAAPRDQEDLRRLSSRFQAVLESVPDIIMEVNADKVYTWSNQAGIEFFGPEVIGREAAFYFEGEQDTYRRVQPIFEGDDSVTYVESWQRRRDGEKRLLAWWCRSLKDNKGRVVGALSTARDITSQLIAEQALMESEEKYRTLVRTSPEAVIVTDTAGKITHVSCQAALMLGFEMEEDLIGRAFTELIAPEHRAKAVIIQYQTYKKGITRETEYQLLRRNGSGFIGEVNSAVVRDAGGNPKWFIHTARDVTERRRVEEQMKTSVREKELLLEEIHHRVKNNLQVISSILDMSRMRIDDPRAVHLLEDAHSKIQTMAFIHSRLYRSRRFDRIDMKAHIKELVNYLQHLLGTGKKVTSHLEVSPVMLPLNQALPCALVINELVSNAYKHAFRSRKPGTLEIIMDTTAGNIAHIVVRDDGIGVQKDFDIQKAETLGLKLVRNLVERQLRGSLQMSRRGCTEFIVRFPIEHMEDSNAENYDR